ncbi:MAG: NAD(P)-binding domain-containing protein [Pseudomonadota bacterium]
MTDSLKVLIVGTGNVARALAHRLKETDHVIVMGSRDAARGAEVGGEIGVTGSASTEHVSDADIVFIAVPFVSLDETLAALGPMSGKIVVDCTNPLTDDYMALTMGHTTSAGEYCADQLPEARVVKAFNAIFADVVHNNPAYNTVTPQVFVAGEDQGAKDTVSDLIHAIGYEPVDCGAMIMARYLEPLAELIIQLAYVQGHGTRITPVIVREPAAPGE